MLLTILLGLVSANVGVSEMQIYSKSVIRGSASLLDVQRPRDSQSLNPASAATAHLYSSRNLLQLQSSVASCEPVEYLCGGSELVMDDVFNAVIAGPCKNDSSGHILFISYTDIYLTLWYPYTNICTVSRVHITDI